MTDRFHSLTVVLERDMREDDAEALIDAIRMFRGVIGVDGNVTCIDSHIAEKRAKYEMTRRIYDAINNSEDCEK